jgi:hypothetical protein
VSWMRAHAYRPLHQKELLLLAPLGRSTQVWERNRFHTYCELGPDKLICHGRSLCSSASQLQMTMLLLGLQLAITGRWPHQPQGQATGLSIPRTPEP